LLQAGTQRVPWEACSVQMTAASWSAKWLRGEFVTTEILSFNIRTNNFHYINFCYIILSRVGYMSRDK
jgi:hypothetical protein